MKQLNTFNQWTRYAVKNQIRIHFSGAISSFVGMTPGFDVGFVSAANNWQALAKYVRNGKVRVGPSLRRQIASRGY